MSRSYETLVFDTPRPHVARIMLNRPAQMNAYTFAMTQELLAAIAAYRDDDDLRALVIAGAGERAFCTGGDISGSDPDHARKVGASPMGHGREMRDGMQAVVLAQRRLD
ncbi:MAG: enoyl-CoA hydratase/isomerase family protein, partial [Phenylobacterium sp.]|nr:enoyl-CoA hydratase/isomerase family protein [Phenylobacterium sp.]